MLNKIREQRDRWQQRAEQLAAFSITDQRKEVFLVFWGCSECTVSQRFFLYQVGNRTHTPPDASIAQLAPIVTDLIGRLTGYVQRLAHAAFNGPVLSSLPGFR